MTHHNYEARLKAARAVEDETEFDKLVQEATEQVHSGKACRITIYQGRVAVIELLPANGFLAVTTRRSDERPNWFSEGVGSHDPV